VAKIFHKSRFNYDICGKSFENSYMILFIITFKNLFVKSVHAFAASWKKNKNP